MRIGDLAELAGISTRAIRHYHRLGLLPEPHRVDGYRTYGLRHAVLLLRLRRLVELGLSLDKAAEVLAVDADRDLRELLAELDADLAEQQRRIGLRRQRLAELLASASASDVSDRLIEVLAGLERVNPAGLARERLIAGLFELISGAVLPGYHPELTARVTELSADFARLRGREPDDPLVDRIAARAAELVQEARLPADLIQAPAGGSRQRDVLRSAARSLDPAQSRCFQLILDAVF